MATNTVAIGKEVEKKGISEKKEMTPQELKDNEDKVEAWLYKKSYTRNRSISPHDRMIFYTLMKNGNIINSSAHNWYDANMNKDCWGCQKADGTLIDFTKIYLDDNNYDFDENGSIENRVDRNTKKIQIRPFQEMGATAILGSTGLLGGNACGFHVWETVDKQTRQPVDKDYGIDDTVELEDYWFDCDPNLCVMQICASGPSRRDAVNLLLLSDKDRESAGGKPSSDDIVKKITKENLHFRTEQRLLEMFPTGFYVGITMPDKTKAQQIIRIKKPPNYEQYSKLLTGDAIKTRNYNKDKDNIDKWESTRWSSVLCGAKNSSGQIFIGKCNVYRTSLEKFKTASSKETANTVSASSLGSMGSSIVAGLREGYSSLTGSKIKDEIGEVGTEAEKGGKKLLQEVEVGGTKFVEGATKFGGKALHEGSKLFNEMMHMTDKKELNHDDAVKINDLISSTLGDIDEEIKTLNDKKEEPKTTPEVAQGGKKKKKRKSFKIKNKKNKKNKKRRKTHRKKIKKLRK